jgi:uncharacterized protein YndB with AHSA1/START domain
MPTGTLELTEIPSVSVGMLIRREPAVVFEALVDPRSPARSENPTTVEFRFTDRTVGTTYVQITEIGSRAPADELARYVAGSTGGFTFLIGALKALLEHGIAPGLVADAHRTGP